VVKIYSFIVAEKVNFPIAFMCRFFDIGRQSYYDWEKAQSVPSARRLFEDDIVAVMQEIHQESDETYGSPRMTPALRNRGFCVNHKRVERLMRQHGMAGYVPRSKIRTTIPADDINNLPDLVKRDFVKPAPDLAWCGDITYVRTGEGWLYLATVLDLGSRRLLGYSMADNIRTELIEKAIRAAVKTRGKPKMDNVIFHSDRGSQYTSGDFKKTCITLGVVRSVGRKATCYDNAVAESFFASLKKEFVHRRKFATRAEARVAIFEWIERWYNNKRLHSTLGYKTPVDWEQSHAQSKQHDVELDITA
jgi:transposase InsO family protein